MAILHLPGDRVWCHLKDDVIVNVYEVGWEDKKVFTIIGNYDDKYLIYVPDDMFLKETIKIDCSAAKKYSLNNRFVDITACFISDYKIVSVYEKLDGMHCSDCNDFYRMSAPNQEDGTLICWSCRNHKHYK